MPGVTVTSRLSSRRCSLKGVAAPLAGTLVYISQTRDVFIGGSALFAMAAGMSVPLLLVGACGPSPQPVSMGNAPAYEAYLDNPGSVPDNWSD